MDRSASEVLVTASEGFLDKELRGPGPGKSFSFFLIVPAIIAFGISCYLGYTTLTASEVAGCGGGTFDCTHVLSSKYSKWMGMPVSILAAANYLVMLFALAAICFSSAGAVARKLSWTAVGLCGLSAGMAAIWFIGLQAFAIGHFCPWCLGAHTCGLVIAIALLIKRPFGTPLTIASIGMAALGISGLILGQVMSEEPPKYKIIDHAPAVNPDSDDGDFLPPGDDDEFFAPPMDNDGDMFEAPGGDEEETTTEDETATSAASFRKLPSLASLVGAFSTTSMLVYKPQQEEAGSGKKQEAGAAKKQEEKPKRRTVAIPGNLRLDPRHWPLLGSPEAKYIFVEMYDYACPHCRNTHRAIQGACQTMGDELAIIVLPVPLNTNCNSAITRTGANFGQSCELSRLAVACWRVDQKRFEDFHHWMFEGVSCPSYSQAKAKAEEMFGRDKIAAELGKETAGKYIQKHVQLYSRAGRGVVPKLLFPTTTVEGEFTSTNSLVNMIRERAR